MSTLIENINRAITDFDSIKNAIENKGVTVGNVATSQYANKIAQIEGGGQPSTEDWTPPSDWFDIETILENDTEDYSAKLIMLLTDKLDNGSTTNKIKGADKYKLSDGQVITPTSYSSYVDISNVFDTSKDKECSEGYKTRYVICYINTTDIRNIEFPSNVLYFVASNTSMSNISFDSKYYLQSFKLKNNASIAPTSTYNMFNNCISLKSIPIFDTSNTNNMSNMFNNCISLKSIPIFDTSNTNNMSNMFKNCISLKSIPELDTSNVTTINAMFHSCRSLKKVPSLDVSKASNLSTMFYNCNSLESIGDLNTTNATAIGSMFYGCYLLKNIPTLDTSNVTNIAQMLYDCYSLEEIPILDTNKATSLNYLFQYCYCLRNINIQNIKLSLKLDTSYSLSKSSLLNILNALVDLTGDTSQTLTLGSKNLEKLTDEEKAIAINKNWTLS